MAVEFHYTDTDVQTKQADMIGKNVKNSGKAVNIILDLRTCSD